MGTVRNWFDNCGTTLPYLGSCVVTVTHRTISMSLVAPPCWAPPVLLRIRYAVLYAYTTVIGGIFA
jgi:hypothetical protein